jgi:hypothetical protein
MRSTGTVAMKTARSRVSATARAATEHAPRPALHGAAADSCIRDRASQAHDRRRHGRGAPEPRTRTASQVGPSTARSVGCAPRAGDRPTIGAAGNGVCRSVLFIQLHTDHVGGLHRSRSRRDLAFRAELKIAAGPARLPCAATRATASLGVRSDRGRSFSASIRSVPPKSLTLSNCGGVAIVPVHGHTPVQPASASRMATSLSSQRRQLVHRPRHRRIRALAKRNARPRTPRTRPRHCGWPRRSAKSSSACRSAR